MATYQFVSATDRAEVEPHLDRARDALRAAELLAAEGLVHDAVSRAHQSTIHAQRTLLATEKRNPTSSRYVQRLALAHYIRNEQVDAGFEERLDWLAMQRTRADDQPLLAVSDEELSESLEVARSFLAAIEDYLDRAGYAAEAE